MEPSTNPAPKQPAPIMDVAPPPKPEQKPVEPPKEAVAPAPAPEPAEKTEPPHAAEKPAAPKAAEKPAKPAKKASTSNKPIAAIILSLLFFVVLSGLAYYAYTQNG